MIQQESEFNPIVPSTMSRRDFLKRFGAGSVILATSAIPPYIDIRPTPVNELEHQLEGVDHVVEFNDIRNAMDAGDLSHHVLVMFHDPDDVSGSLRAGLLEKGVMLNINHPLADEIDSDQEAGEIKGTLIYLAEDTSWEQAEIFATRFVQQHTSSSLFRIPFANVESQENGELSYQNIDDDFWQLRAVGLLEEKIAVEDTEWSEPEILDLGEHSVRTTDQYVIAQLWDGKDSTRKFHYLIGPDQQVDFPGKVQGTLWHVSGITDSNLSSLVARYEQMNQEVIDRDEQPGTVERIVAGRDPAIFATLDARNIPYVLMAAYREEL